MKLTKQQRHMAYMIMLAEVETNFSFYKEWGLCLLIKTALGICNRGFIDDNNYVGYVNFDDVITNFFPELNAKMAKLEMDELGYSLPRNNRGWQKRRCLLITCITETA